MVRRTALLVALVLMPATPAQAGQVNIELHDNFFAPDEIGNQVGDTVRWFSDGTSNDHNVREDGLLFFSGPESNMPLDFPVVFSAGTYHYYCEVHGTEFGGMDGLVRIPVRISRAPDGLLFTVRWATDASETGSVYDIQFRVGPGDWRSWRTNTSTLNGVFGRNRNPVRVRDGVLYRFRARSQEGAEFSRYSPVRSIRP
jgi:plastocyanin